MNHLEQNSESGRDQYFELFYAELSERVGRCRVRDAEDIVQHEGSRVLLKLEQLPARYPDPVIYARMRTKPAISDYLRRNKAQRGEGCRATRDLEGRVVNGRIVESGDAPKVKWEPDYSLFDQIGNELQAVDELVDQLETSDLLTRALLSASPDEVEVLYLSYGLQYRDADIARMLGLSRETINRKKRGAVRRIRGGLSADDV